VLLAALLALGAFAAPAAAATKAQQKQAVSRLAKSTSAALKGHAADLKNVDALFALQMQLLEKQVAVFGWSLQARADLFAAVTALRQGQRQSIEAALLAAVQGAREALGSLPGGTPSAQWPADFHAGTGGRLDKFAAALLRNEERQRLRAEKRLLQSAKRLAKDGVALTAVLAPTLAAPAWHFDENVAEVNPPRTGLDTLVAVSRLDQDDDGVLLAAGNGQTGATVRVLAAPPDGSEPLAEDAAAGDGIGWRWSVVFGAVDALQEGAWRVVASRLDEVEFEARNIGVR